MCPNICRTGRNDYARCGQCSYKTYSLQRLKIHNARMHLSRQTTLYKCKLCDYYAEDKQSSGLHIIQSHPELLAQSKMQKEQQKEEDGEIPIRDKAFLNQPLDKWGNTKSEDHDIDNFLCFHCEDAFSDQSELDNHLAYIADGGYKCPKYSCTYVFEDEEQIAAHIIQDHPFSCSLCDRVFPTKEVLEEHEREEKSPGAKCKQCGAGPFRDTRLYLEHIFSNHPKNERLADMVRREEEVWSLRKIGLMPDYTCLVCDRTWDNWSLGNLHVRTMHTHLTGFNCHLCNVVCKSDMNLQKHMLNTALHKYKCQQCTKGFKFPFSLIKHDIAEHGRTALYRRTKHGCYACRTCKKSYETEKMAFRHYNDVHDAGNRYSCQYCSMVLVQKSSLKRHLEVAHKVRDIRTCPECQVEVEGQRKFQKHMREEHKK